MSHVSKDKMKRLTMLKGYPTLSKFHTIVIAILLYVLEDVYADGIGTEKSTEQSTEKSTSRPNTAKSIEQNIPKYQFQYFVQDANSGDYKTQEESRDGEQVRGSYSVAEPNGDLRYVTYTADVKNGFRADVKFLPNASPMSHRQTKSNRSTNPHKVPGIRGSSFTPSHPRYVQARTISPLPRTTIPRTAPARFESLRNSGLKTMELHAKKPESEQLGAKEMPEKEAVVVEMHLNDGTEADSAGKKPSNVTEKIDAGIAPQEDKKIELSTQKTLAAPGGTASPEILKPATNATQVDKALHEQVKMEVEQIITSKLAQQQASSVEEELRKEASLADKDLRGIHHADAQNGEGRSNARNAEKDELQISVHQNVKTDEAQNRAQKKYSTFQRPLRLVEQVPVGNYQLQTLSEPPNINPVENGNSHNNYDYNSNGYVGNSNYYYDPTLAAAVSNYYGNQPGVTHINGNSLRPQSLYDQYPAESQQYAIGYEWVKMNPRMVNSNGESYIIMDPDYSSTKTFFGYPRPTALFHHLTKHKFKPHEMKPQDMKPQETKPQENKYELNKPQNADQQPASTVKEPVMIAQKNAPHLAPVTGENSPKHDQQIPQYFKKDQEKSANPESSKQNLTQKYLESLQAVPLAYPMDVVKVPAPVPSGGVIKQLPVIQPATINPIPAITWPTGPVAINPAIAFILLPLQAAQDPPIQPIIVN